jgi:hypothetical protein
MGKGAADTFEHDLQEGVPRQKGSGEDNFSNPLNDTSSDPTKPASPVATSGRTSDTGSNSSGIETGRVNISEILEDVEAYHGVNSCMLTALCCAVGLGFILQLSNGGEIARNNVQLKEWGLPASATELTDAKVRKTVGPEVGPTSAFSSSLYIPTARNAWANLYILGQPNTLLAPGGRRLQPKVLPAHRARPDDRRAQPGAVWVLWRRGLGRYTGQLDSVPGC